jgi:hypothetical protein
MQPTATSNNNENRAIIFTLLSWKVRRNMNHHKREIN